MPVLFQRFELNLEAMTKLGEQELLRLNLPRAGRILRRDLVNRGYLVLESHESFGGVPKDILVGGQLTQGHKADFGEITERLGLVYDSREYYAQRNAEEAAASTVMQQTV